MTVSASARHVSAGVLVSLALLGLAACGGGEKGSTSTTTTAASTTNPPTTSAAPTTTVPPESEYLVPLSSAIRAAMFNIGFPLHAEDAECMARTTIEDLGNATLRRLGSPSELSVEVRSNGIDRLTDEMSVPALNRLAVCIGPAHRLEFFLGGSWGTTRLSERSEVCLRDLEENDDTFQKTFLDVDAVPPRWELQTEQCLRAGGDDDAILALFGDDLPSRAPDFVYEEGGLRRWWPGGLLVGCGEMPGETYQVGVLLVDLVHGSARLLGPDLEFTCERASMAPDGHSVVYTMEDEPGLRLIQISEDTSTRLNTGTIRDAGSPDWSPNGTWIAFHREDAGEVYIIRPDGTGLKRVGRGSTPLWSADSKYLLVQSPDWDGIELIDVARRTQRRLIPDAQSASWAPTGDRIAYVLNDKLRFWSLADGDLGPVVSIEQTSIYETFAPIWSPDGEWVLVNTYDYEGVVVEADTGAVHRVGSIRPGPETDIDWIPDPPTTSDA